MLASVAHHCSASSVNRKLAALTSFCEFHARRGVQLAGLLVTMAPAGKGRSAVTSYKPFLHHITKGNPARRRTIDGLYEEVADLGGQLVDLSGGEPPDVRRRLETGEQAHDVSRL